MNSSINNKQDEIIEDFSLMDDWADKYRYIIEIGQAASSLPDELKTQDRKIKGCQSDVWLNTNLNNGILIFEGDSNALITKGLINLLISVLSNQKPNDILEADIYFMEKIGLSEHLSPTRANGLASMMKQIKIYALAYLDKIKQDTA